MKMGVGVEGKAKLLVSLQEMRDNVIGKFTAKLWFS